MNGIRKDLNCRPHSLDEGFSFVELMVVIVIIVIVATLALMQRGSANEQFQRQNVARELKVALERARFDSVKRRAVDNTAGGGVDQRAKVVVNANSFVLWVDTDGDGEPAAAESVQYPFPTGVTASTYSTGTLPETLHFSMRGEAISSGSSHFMVCNGTCGTAPGTSADTNIVLVTPTGTVNFLAGGSSIPTFTNPSVTSVSNSTGIRPDVVLP